MANTFIGVLKNNKDFLRIWISQLTSQIALNMLTFAVVLHIYQTTHSNASISLVLIATSIPSVLLGPFSGVIADRLNYKSILTWNNFLRFAVVLLLIVAKGNTLAILEIIFLISAITQFFAPAELSSIPLIVPKNSLVSANSVAMTTMYGSLLIGYTLAGPLMGLITTNGLFLLCGLLYLIATLAVSGMSHYDHKEVRKITLSTLAADIESIWRETVQGVSKIRRDKSITEPMLKMAVGWMMLGAFVVLIPSFGEKVLGISSSYIGLMVIGPAGIGMLIGSYILDKKRTYDFKRAINNSMFFVGLALLLFALYHFYSRFFFGRGISTILMIILGIGVSFIYVSAQTMLHLNSEKSFRGRVFGLNSMSTNLAFSLPSLVVGGIADITSPLVAMLFLSIGILIYGSALLFEPKTRQPSS